MPYVGKRHQRFGSGLMKKFNDLQEDLLSTLAGAAARGAASGLGIPVPRERPSDAGRDDERDTGGRAYTQLNPNMMKAGEVVRTYGLDRRLISILQPACRQFGIDLSPSSRGQDPNKYGRNEYFKKFNGWTGSPRHVSGLAGDFIVYDATTKERLPITDYKAGSDGSKRMYAFCMYINRLAKRKGLHLSVGAGEGYMGKYTMHIDIARGLLEFPFPYATGYEGSTKKPPRTADTSYVEYGRGTLRGLAGVPWWEDGRRTGIVKFPVTGVRVGKTWTSEKPYWLTVLDQKL